MNFHDVACLSIKNSFLISGKTFQAIAIADFYKDDWPLLIVTTATARDNWAQHIQDLLPAVPNGSVKVLVSTSEYVGDCKVLITSYSLMDRYVDTLSKKSFGCIILVRENEPFSCSFFRNVFYSENRMNRTRSKTSKQNRLKVPFVCVRKPNESFCCQVNNHTLRPKPY